MQTNIYFSSLFRKAVIYFLLIGLIIVSINFYRQSRATTEFITAPAALSPISPDDAGSEIIFPEGSNDEVKQEDVRVVGLANGNILTGWDIDIASGDLLARIFDKAGAPVTNDIKLYDSGGNSNDVALVSKSDGGFYSLWFSSAKIQVREFDAAGIAAGASTTLVNDTVDLREPEMVELSNGNFMLTYHRASNGYEVMAQLFDADLSALSTAIVINTLAISTYVKPEVAPIAGGESIISWAGSLGNGDPAVFIQVLDSDGAKSGSNVQVNSAQSTNQQIAPISTSGNNTVMIVYESDGIDTTFRSIAGRIFNADGTPATDEFQVNQTLNASLQQRPDVVGMSDGSFVAVWESYGQEEGLGGDGAEAIVAVQIAEDGSTLSDEFVVNQSQDGTQKYPFVSVISGTVPVVVWEGIELVDTDSDGIDSSHTDGFMRILDRSEAVATNTPTATATSTITPTVTVTKTPSPTETATSVPTRTPSQTPTDSPQTATPILSPATETPMAGITSSPTPEISSTVTMVPTIVSTPTIESTPSAQPYLFLPFIQD